MKKITFLLLTSFLIFSACNWINCKKGSGEIVTKSFDGMRPTKVSISMHADVMFAKGSQDYIEITTYENLFSELEIEEKGNKVDIDTRTCINTNETPKIVVHYTDLKEVKVNGSSDIHFKEAVMAKNFLLKINGSGDVDLPFQGKNIELKINGSGDLKVYGTAASSEIKINGSGDIDASDLKTEKSEVKINGSGDVKINVSESLSTTITGSGDVTYYGNPISVETQTVGSGNVNKAD